MDVFVSDSNTAQCFILCVFCLEDTTWTQELKTNGDCFYFYANDTFHFNSSSNAPVAVQFGITTDKRLPLAVFTSASSSVWSAGALPPRRRPRSRAPCRGRGRGPGWRCSPACRTPPASASRSPRSSPRRRRRRREELEQRNYTRPEQSRPDSSGPGQQLGRWGLGGLGWKCCATRLPGGFTHFKQFSLQTVVR